MISPLCILLLLCGALLLASAALAQAKPEATSMAAQTVIAHVTVINPGTASVHPDSLVVINGDRITFVSHSVAVPLAKNTRVINGRGQFLIPGLWDMHVHSAFGDWFPGGRDIILPLFIANGVTGVRDMGGDLPVLFAWRKQIAAGKIIGPRMIVSGPMLDALLPDGKLSFPSSLAFTTPESAVAAVDSLKAQGVDFIKVQSVISHDAYLAAAAEAHKVGLPIVGHVPDTRKITAVIANGRLFDRAALDCILKQVESAAKRNSPQARTNFRTGAISTFSSRTGTSANTREQRP